MASGVKMAAAIDIGSNLARMLLAQIGPSGQLKIIDEIKKPVHIGRDTYLDGRIRPQTVEELCKILKNCTILMKDYGIRDYRAVSTSGLREAENRDYVLDKIFRMTGLRVEVINNSVERMLTHKALWEELPQDRVLLEEGILIVDIGSGGVEITVYDQGHLQFTEYIRIGSLRIRETLAELESTTINFSALLEDYLESKIKFLRNRIKKHDLRHFIALGGELGSIYKVLGESKDKKARRLSKERLIQFYKEIQHQSNSDLSAAMKISMQQAETVLPTLAILIQFFSLTQNDKIFIPAVSLRYGILVDMADKQLKTSRQDQLEEDIRRCALYVSRRYDCDEKHLMAVRDMAITVFDKTKRLHAMGNAQRLHLELAVLLHEIGAYINEDSAAFHGYNIIGSLDLIGLSDEERNRIALIVKLYQNDKPEEDLSFQVLPYEERIIVSKLSAILGICAVLDMGGKRKIKNFEVSMKNTQVQIQLTTNRDFTLEQWLFKNQKGHFESVMGCPISLKVKV